MAMPLTRHRFTVDDYHRMAEAGILSEDDRVELLDGQVVPMTPIGPRHAWAVAALTNTLAQRFAGRALVSPQNPVGLDRYEEPQPDIAVLALPAARYRSVLPGLDDVLLLIEVADTSRSHDREYKIPLYARYGIREVWLVNLVNDRLEVYREPRERRYLDVSVATRGETISPLWFPDFSIAVDEILG